MLSPGESTSTLTFTVKHKGQRFSYFVNAYAVVEGQVPPEGCNADGVFEGDVTIRNQAQIDALEGCTKIDGDLLIFTGASTLDFSPLDSLKSITRSFSVRGNPSLTSISGFANLEDVGASFVIFGNDALVSVSGFGQIDGISVDFAISSNDALVSVAGFGNLKFVGSFGVNNNDALISIPEFGALVLVSRVFSISRNGALASFAGFEKLRMSGSPEFTKSFYIDANVSLVSIAGFDSLSFDNTFVLSFIRYNLKFDCSIPPQSNLPFFPVDESTFNLVNCPTK